MLSSGSFSIDMEADTSNEQYGGYDYNFINKTPPDRLICMICHFPSKDPQLSGCCGHLYCKSCLDATKQSPPITSQFTSGLGIPCPTCRTADFATFPQKEADREIKGLLVYCSNKEKGCEWKGELNCISDHLNNSDGCKFEDVECPNKCEEMIERQHLTSHVEKECPCRKANCQYCHDTGEHQFIVGQHKKECPMLPIQCPNNCEFGPIPRDNIEAHRKECPLEKIQCEYHNLGCEDKVVRKDLEKHDKEKMKEHLKMTKYKLSELNDIRHELDETKAKLNDALKQITNLTVLMNAQLIMNQYINCGNIRSVHLDSTVMMYRLGKQECPVTIKMPEYNIKKRDGMEWFSDPFYTKGEGYKMCLRIDADGHKGGKGSHLSVYLHMMKGPHDDKLTWPLQKNFRITLLNQISDDQHYSLSVIYANKMLGNRVTEGDKAVNGHGSARFISNEDLQRATPTCQYLKDDCLYFQISKV